MANDEQYKKFENLQKIELEELRKKVKLDNEKKENILKQLEEYKKNEIEKNVQDRLSSKEEIVKKENKETERKNAEVSMRNGNLKIDLKNGQIIEYKIKKSENYFKQKQETINKQEEKKKTFKDSLKAIINYEKAMQYINNKDISKENDNEKSL